MKLIKYDNVINPLLTASDGCMFNKVHNRTSYFNRSWMHTEQEHG